MDEFCIEIDPEFLEELPQPKKSKGNTKPKSCGNGSCAGVDGIEPEPEFDECGNPKRSYCDIAISTDTFIFGCNRLQEGHDDIYNHFENDIGFSVIGENLRFNCDLGGSGLFLISTADNESKLCNIITESCENIVVIPSVLLQDGPGKQNSVEYSMVLRQENKVGMKKETLYPGKVRGINYVEGEYNNIFLCGEQEGGVVKVLRSSHLNLQKIMIKSHIDKDISKLDFSAPYAFGTRTILATENGEYTILWPMLIGESEEPEDVSITIEVISLELLRLNTINYGNRLFEVATLNVTPCGDKLPLEWPEENPVEIDPGLSVDLEVTGGIPETMPITWEILSGQGYSLGDGDQIVTGGATMVLYASDDCCGEVTLNVYDECSNVEETLRPSNILSFDKEQILTPAGAIEYLSIVEGTGALPFVWDVSDNITVFSGGDPNDTQVTLMLNNNSCDDGVISVLDGCGVTVVCQVINTTPQAVLDSYLLTVNKGAFGVVRILEGTGQGPFTWRMEGDVGKINGGRPTDRYIQIINTGSGGFVHLQDLCGEVQTCQIVN